MTSYEDKAKTTSFERLINLCTTVKDDKCHRVITCRAATSKTFKKVHSEVPTPTATLILVEPNNQHFTVQTIDRLIPPCSIIPSKRFSWITSLSIFFQQNIIIAEFQALEMGTPGGKKKHLRHLPYLLFVVIKKLRVGLFLLRNWASQSTEK